MVRKPSLPYTVADYDELEIGEYRTRFPEETKGMSDKLVFEIVMSTDDDMDDDEWRELFKTEQLEASAE